MKNADLVIILLQLMFIFSGIHIHADDNEENPSVETKLGKITGTYKIVTGFGKQMLVERYLGIPYAEPPIGDLRFRKPVPRKPFTPSFSAVKFGNSCFQVVGMLPLDPSRLSEDCLFLNVFVSSERTGSLPVMIFIHGGGFISGSADPAVSDTLAAYGDVIVVTIHYRLTLWGFLSTGDKHAPGNYGLWDQQLAIQWVHDNIEAFGGDPRQVTVFGESAGSLSVILQSLYEGNEGLFHRGIAQSGSITAPIVSNNEQKKDAEKLGALVGCTDTESEKLVECIRSVPIDVLNSTLNNASNGFMGFPMPFTPSVDGEFLKESPKDLLNGDSEISSAGRKFFSTVDLMMGINAEEGAIFGALVGIFDMEFKPNRTFYEENIIPTILSFAFGTDVPEAIKELVIHEYTDWSDPGNMKKRQHMFGAILADILFSVTLVDTAARHDTLANGSSGTYMYMFDVTPSVHLLPTPSWLKRATHGDELIYVFFDESGELMNEFPGHEDYVPLLWEHDVAKEIITMWSNFAKTGNPNKPTPVQVSWPEYTKRGQKYLHITKNMNDSESIKSHLFTREHNLWTKILPAVKKAIEKDSEEETGYCEKDTCKP